MIRPTAKTPKTTDTTVSAISHLGFQPSSGLSSGRVGHADPAPSPGEDPNGNDYSPVWQGCRQENPTVTKLEQSRQACDELPPGRIQYVGLSPLAWEPASTARGNWPLI